MLIKDGVLRIRDREQRLLAKVKRSWNRLYLLDLKVEKPICLAAERTEEPWLWHARYRGHLTFCHPYGWHSFVCHFYTGIYIFAIVNSNTPNFLSFLLMWHATQSASVAAPLLPLLLLSPSTR